MIDDFTIDPPKMMDEKALGHIIDVLDMHCKHVAKRLEKEQKVRLNSGKDVPKPLAPFDANSFAFSTEIAFDVVENWRSGHPTQTQYIITDQVSGPETKRIKNWFERQRAKRRWLLQIIVMNRTEVNGKDPDEIKF